MDLSGSPTILKRLWRKIASCNGAVFSVIIFFPPLVPQEVLSEESSPWQIDADRLSRFTNPEAVVAEGDVVMTRKDAPFSGASSWHTDSGSPGGGDSTSRDVIIRGDWIRYDPKANVVTVRGKASLDSQREKIEAEYAHLNLKSQTGILHQATLYFPKEHLLLGGERVEKTGELTYRFEDGWATKCEPQAGVAPPWSFGWSKAQLTEEGFVHLQNVTFRVKDFPFVYSPYFAFSTNKERKTGLLLPELSHSGRDGAGIVVPLFLNLSPSYDATIYSGYLTERGNIAAAEFRYVTDSKSQGTFAVTYLNDRLDDQQNDYKSDGIYRKTSNRYWLRGKANHEFGRQLSAKLDLDLVSDQDYLQEFQDGKLGFDASQDGFHSDFGRGFNSKTTVLRENTLQMTKRWSHFALMGGIRTIDDPTDRESTSHIWSLPHIVFSGRYPLLENSATRAGFLGLFNKMDLDFDSEYLYYWREDNLSTQRLDLHPRIVWPLRIFPYLETTASAGLRETFYLVDDRSPLAQGYDSDLLERTIQDYNITTSTIFKRHFTVALQGHSQLTHLVRPELSYDYIPTQSQTSFPNLDRIDRIDPQNSITYRLRNDFWLSSPTSSNTMKRRYAFVAFSQSYDIHEERKKLLSAGQTRHPFSPLGIESGFEPFKNLRVYYESDLDVYGAGFVKYAVRSEYARGGLGNWGLEYRYEKEAEISQLNGNFLEHFTDRISLSGGIQHSFVVDKTTEASLGLLYDPECWSMELLFATTADDDYRISLIFALEGIGKVLGLSQTLYVADSGGFSTSQ